MILGGESSIFTTGTWFENYQQLNRPIGLKGVEVSFMAQERYRLWNRNLTKEQIGRIKQTLKPFRRITYHAAFFELSLLAAHPGIRELTLKEYLFELELAKKLGVYAVNFHPIGTIGEGEYLSRKEKDDLMTGYLKAVDRKAGSLGIKACWETGCGYFSPLKKFERIRELNLKHTGICMDVGHLVGSWKGAGGWKKVKEPAGGLNTFSKFIGRFGDLIWSCHIHDWQDKPNGKHVWNDHHMVGNGIIDWDEVFSSLVKAGFNGNLSLEYHPDAVGKVEDYVASCEHVRRLVRKCGGEII